MFEKLWIDKINPSLKEIVLGAIKRGAKVSYNPFSKMVIINYSPVSMQGFNAETGELVMRS